MCMCQKPSPVTITPACSHGEHKSMHGSCRAAVQQPAAAPRINSFLDLTMCHFAYDQPQGFPAQPAACRGLKENVNLENRADQSGQESISPLNDGHNLAQSPQEKDFQVPYADWYRQISEELRYAASLHQEAVWNIRIFLYKNRRRATRCDTLALRGEVLRLRNVARALEETVWELEHSHPGG